MLRGVGCCCSSKVRCTCLSFIRILGSVLFQPLFLLMDVSKLVYASVTNGQKVNKVIFIFQSFLRIEIKREAQKKYATYTGKKKGSQF